MQTAQKKLEQFISQIDDIIEKSKALAIKSIYAATDERIFNDGQDKFNVSLGTYKSESYKKKRQRKGRQTTYIDLTFTTNLKTSIVSNDIDTIYFKNEYGKSVSANIEKNLGRRIFAPSQTEAEIFTDILNEEIDKFWK